MVAETTKISFVDLRESREDVVRFIHRSLAHTVSLVQVGVEISAIVRSGCMEIKKKQTSRCRLANDFVYQSRMEEDDTHNDTLIRHTSCQISCTRKGWEIR